MKKLLNPYSPALIFTACLIFSFLFGYTPLLLMTVYFIIGLATYILYWKDKRAARYGTWRTKESTLHLCSLICGWVGAIFAQQNLRHKTKKKSFRYIFWLTVFINVGMFVWLHTSDGSSILRKYIDGLEFWVVTNEVLGSYVSVFLDFTSVENRLF